MYPYTFSGLVIIFSSLSFLTYGWYICCLFYRYCLKTRNYLKPIYVCILCQFIKNGSEMCFEIGIGGLIFLSYPIVNGALFYPY